MADGRLESWDLIADVPQALIKNYHSSAAAMYLNITNRGGATAYISAAVSTNQYSPTDAEWFIFEQAVDPNGTFIRPGILVPPDSYLIVKSTRNDVSANIFGVVTGTVETEVVVGRNLWQESSFTFSAGETVSYQLPAAGLGTTTFSIQTGTLPSSLSLSSSGLLTGTLSTTGYSPEAGDVTSELSVLASDDVSGASIRTINIIKRYNDGSSSSRAAPSAAIINDLTGTTTDGAYWIDLGNGPFQTYCIMSGGAGYMLAGKISSTFEWGNWDYNGAYWSGTTTQGSCADLSDSDAVCELYWNHTLTTGFRMALASASNYISVSSTGSTPLNVFTGPEVNLESSLSRSNFMSWINTAGVSSTYWDNQPNSNRIRINLYNNSSIPNVAMRFGIAMNNETDDASDDSAVGFGVYTNNNSASGIRNTKAGGHSWNPDRRWPLQGFIFVK